MGSRSTDQAGSFGSRIAALATALSLGCAACSSGSSPTGSRETLADGGADATDLGQGTDAAPVGINASCGELSVLSGGSPSGCEPGQTCCTTVALGSSITSISANATCVAKGQCTSGISNECQTAQDCGNGQVCCGGPADPDASATIGGGILGALNLSGLETACQATCAPTQQQQCGSDDECPAGETCQTPTAPGNATFGGLGMNAAADASTFMVARVCAVPVPDAGSGASEGGVPVVPDSGPDGVTASDAGDLGDAANVP
jgi:hypothetical protein